MTESAQSFDGACHCGCVRFTVRLNTGLQNPVRCNCSYCRMKGAVILFASLENLSITEGEDQLSVYQFRTHSARHYFCSRCGIHTHHQRRFDPRQFAVNAACLSGVSPFDFTEVPVLDGEHHPLDGAGGPLAIAGHLHFETD